jgi:beta-lactamase class A
MPRLLAWLLLIFGGLASSPAAAQPAGAPEPLRAKAEALIGVLNGKSEPERLFAKAFLAQVPPAQVKAISQQLTAQLGPARSVQRIDAKSAVAGTVFIDCEKGALQLELAVEPQPPHLIQGLLMVGTAVKGDSLTKVVEELKALPGRTSFAVARLDDVAPALLARHEAARLMAVGSAFKLFILAELDRSIRAGERKWSDVAPLTHRSLPSGFLQDWPAGSQLTLQTLAALMISQSDNTATDTLLHLLGRE